MKKVHIKQSVISEIRKLQRLPHESNGKITIDEDGEVDKWTHRKGQTMEACTSGCILNYHTHPPDYENLYPDHPSSTDMKYIYHATCSRREVGSHLIFTPKYIYAINFSCKTYKRSFSNFWGLRRKIDQLFEELAAAHDRASESFRTTWLNELRLIGFVIREFRYTERVEFESPTVPTLTINTQDILIVLVLILTSLYVANVLAVRT